MGLEWRRHAGAVTSLPNIVTLSRLPLVILVLLSLESLWRYPLFALFVLSDGVDGWLARKLEQTSELGAILDPALDKITALLLFVVLFDRTGLAWEYAILFFARDGFVMSLSLLIPFVEIPDTSKIKARPLGKAVTNLQFFVLVAMLVPHHDATIVLLWALGITSALAVGDYVVIVMRELLERRWVHTLRGTVVSYAAVLVVFGVLVYAFLGEEFDAVLALFH
jgi:phosphatidylglycerophosphate synthase